MCKVQNHNVSATFPNTFLFDFLEMEAGNEWNFNGERCFDMFFFTCMVTLQLKCVSQATSVYPVKMLWQSGEFF